MTSDPEGGTAMGTRYWDTWDARHVCEKGYRRSLNAEAVDKEHVPHLRAVVSLSLEDGPQSALGTVAAWTSAGWSTILTLRDDELVLSREAVNREDDWHPDADADLQGLLEYARGFLAPSGD